MPGAFTTYLQNLGVWSPLAGPLGIGPAVFQVAQQSWANSLASLADKGQPPPQTPAAAAAPRPSPTGQLRGGSPDVLRWAPYIQEASAKHGVPQDVIAAIIELESSGNPQARSAAGAIGLMQVMPQYHSARAQKYGGSLEDPRVNILVGTEILKENYDRIKAQNPSLPDDVAWNYAAAAYFGAFDWGKLQPTGAQDVYGTTGYAYVDRFAQNRAKYRVTAPAGSPLSGPMNVSAWTGGQSYPLTQGFGQTEFAKTSGFYQSGSHPGIDIGAPQGTRVTAPLSGRVVQAGWNGGYGYSVTLEVQYQGKAYQVLIGHLAGPPAVQPGQEVQPGQVLGVVGSTGASTGPHVHLEVRDNGAPVDPGVLFVY